MADAMKLLPDVEAEGERIVRDTYKREGDFGYLWTDVVGAVQTAISEERARWTAASPPAREEAPDHIADAGKKVPTEGAGEREEIARIVEPSAFLEETGSHSRVYRNLSLQDARANALTKADLILALRNRTSEPEAREAGDLLAGRDRFIVAKGLWLEFVATLPDHPAPATADKLRLEVREAFLDFIANSKFTEEVDGDADPDGGPDIVTVDYRIECDGGVLADFCHAIGIEADAWNHNVFAAINAAVAEEPEALAALNEQPQ